ncbi:MAG: rhamnulokinase, partial [Actinobacteria bacterium]|nr:rhamnulokinase [Actinomycetota bacterium]
KVEVYHIVGGGTNNKLFCQWISDAFGVQVIAGPVETTSVGNLLMQLKASGDITDIAQGRKISYDSSKLSFYEPKDCSVWDDAYGRCLDTVFKSI